LAESITKTNNDLSVVTTFFVDALKTGEVVPNFLRKDCRTEIGLTTAMQWYLNAIKNRIYRTMTMFTLYWIAFHAGTKTNPIECVTEL